jgi:hypothetical protein
MHRTDRPAHRDLLLAVRDLVAVLLFFAPAGLDTLFVAFFAGFLVTLLALAALFVLTTFFAFTVLAGLLTALIDFFAGFLAVLAGLLARAAFLAFAGLFARAAFLAVVALFAFPAFFAGFLALLAGSRLRATPGTAIVTDSIPPAALGTRSWIPASVVLTTRFRPAFLAASTALFAACTRSVGSSPSSG